MPGSDGILPSMMMPSFSPPLPLDSPVPRRPCARSRIGRKNRLGAISLLNPWAAAAAHELVPERSHQPHDANDTGEILQLERAAADRGLR